MSKKANKARVIPKQLSISDSVDCACISGRNTALEAVISQKREEVGGDAVELVRAPSQAAAALAPPPKRRRTDELVDGEHPTPLMRAAPAGVGAVADEDVIEIIEDEETSAAGKASSATAPAPVGAKAALHTSSTSSSASAGAPKSSLAAGGGWAMLGRISARKIDVELEGDAEMHMAPLPPGVSAAALLAHVRSLTLEVEPTFKIRGEPCVMHRCVGFFSDDSGGYKYARQESKAQPLTSELRDLIAAVNAQLGTDYNGILINRYRSGSDYMGAHADDESELGEAVPPGSAPAPASRSSSSSSGSGASAAGCAVGGAGAAAGSAAGSTGAAGASAKSVPGRAGAGGFRGVCVSCISLGAERTFRLRDKGSKKLVKKGDVRLPHASLMTMAGADFQRLYTHEIPVQEKVHGERFSLTFRRHLK